MVTMKPSQLPDPCPVCKVRHASWRRDIDIRDPDDEIVGHGFFHVERMDDDNVWVGFTGPDGGCVHLDLYAKDGKVVMYVRDERGL